MSVSQNSDDALFIPWARLHSITTTVLHLYEVMGKDLKMKLKLNIDEKRAMKVGNPSVLGEMGFPVLRGIILSLEKQVCSVEHPETQ